jgi:hypothetical protein
MAFWLTDAVMVWGGDNLVKLLIERANGPAL